MPIHDSPNPDPSRSLPPSGGPSSTRDDNIVVINPHTTLTSDLLSSLTTQVTQDVLQALAQRERIRSWTLIAFVTLLALLAFVYTRVITTNLANTLVDAELSARYSEFDTRFNALRTDLEFESVYQEFIALSQPIIDAGPLRSIEAAANHDRLIQTLEQLALSQERLAAKDTFPTLLAGVVNVATSTEWSADVDKLDELFHTTLTTHPDSIMMMVTHYGRIVLGSVLPLDSQPRDNLDRLLTYAAAADQQGLRELFILWNLLLEFQRNDFQASDITDDLLQAAAYLDEERTNNFNSHLALLSDPSRYLYDVTYEAITLGRKINQLVDVYPQLQNGVDEQRQFLSRLGFSSLLSGLRAARSERGADTFLAIALQLAPDNDDWERLETTEGTLRSGASESLPLTVTAGREYRLVGACDARCGDLDLVLVAGGDVILAADRRADNVPELRYTADASGTLSVEVEMFSCGVLECDFAMAVLERRPQQAQPPSLR